MKTDSERVVAGVVVGVVVVNKKKRTSFLFNVQQLPQQLPVSEQQFSSAKTVDSAKVSSHRRVVVGVNCNNYPSRVRILMSELLGASNPDHT